MRENANYKKIKSNISNTRLCETDKNNFEGLDAVILNRRKKISQSLGNESHEI